MPLPPFRDLVIKADKADAPIHVTPPNAFKSFCRDQAPALSSKSGDSFAGSVLTDRGAGVPTCVVIRRLRHEMHCPDDDPCLDEFVINGFEDHLII